MAVRLAVSTLAWVRAAPRGMTSTAAVEITAKASSGATSADGGRRAGPIERGDGVEARRRRLAEVVPVRRPRSCSRASRPRRPAWRRRPRTSSGAARSTTRSISGAGEPPVDRVGHDPLTGAGAVQLEVGGIVLGEDADAIAAGEPERGQPGGQRVDALPELTERDRPLAVDDRGGAAVDVRAARDHVVDREGLRRHLAISSTTGRRCPSSSGPGRPAAPAWPWHPRCSCRAP